MQIVVIVQNDYPTARIFVAFVFPRRHAVFVEHKQTGVRQFYRRRYDAIENPRRVPGIRYNY